MIFLKSLIKNIEEKVGGEDDVFTSDISRTLSPPTSSRRRHSKLEINISENSLQEDDKPSRLFLSPSPLLQMRHKSRQNSETSDVRSSIVNLEC